MSQTRSYRQACSLAVALDLVGERWTLLIIRELLLGPKRFGDLGPKLQGIGANLLTARLKELEANGIIEKSPCSPGSKRMQYQLTRFGRGLENVLRELLRWASGLTNTHAHDTYIYHSDWDLVALKLLYHNGKHPNLKGTIRIVSNDKELFASPSPNGLILSPHADAPPLATIEGDRNNLERLIKGNATLIKLMSERSLKVSGNIAYARKWAACFS